MSIGEVADVVAPLLGLLIPWYVGVGAVMLIVETLHAVLYPHRRVEV